MTSPNVSRLVMVVSACVALNAVAQAEATAEATAPSVSAKAPDDFFELRARYSFAYRFGEQSDLLGPGLSYKGVKPNGQGFDGWVWFLFDRVGLAASFEREGFALFTDDATAARVTSGGLVRFHAGPTGRLRFGIFRIEALAAYAFHQLPDFGNSATPQLRAASRHAVMLASRALVDIGKLRVEGHVEWPIALATTDGSGTAARAPGLSAGANVSYEIIRTGPIVWAAMVDGSYVQDALFSSNVVSRQRMIRWGLSLDVKWREEPKVITTGLLRVAVVDQDNAPLPRATLNLSTAMGPVAGVLDESGSVSIAEVKAGDVKANATLEGYEPAETSGTLLAGQELKLRLSLTKILPKVGSLVVSVADKVSKVPVANAEVEIGDKKYTTNASGVARAVDLPPGPINVKVIADTYQPGAEAAIVVAGVESTLNVDLLSAKKREPATITGLVRSNRGGMPVQANLEIPEAKIKTRANDKGSFIFRLVGGTYTVKISAQGYVTQTKQLTVKDAEQAILNVDLQPK